MDNAFGVLTKNRRYWRAEFVVAFNVRHGVCYAYDVCMIVFSRHALQRMEERGFTRDDVLAVIDGRDAPSLILRSVQDEIVDVYVGYAGAKHLFVPVNRKTRSVITVRPMRTEERQAYAEWVKHEKT